MAAKKEPKNESHNAPEQTCPSCGYCPTCGRRSGWYQQIPYNPYPRPYWYWTAPYSGTWTITSGGASSSSTVLNPNTSATYTSVAMS